jgi:TRAP-type mannitol/chloroaromatic compound transport system permease small subunit
MKEKKYLICLIKNFSYKTGMLVSLLLIPLTFIAAYEVFRRYFLDAPTIWAWDLNIQLMAAIAMLGGGYTLYEKGHVSVDVLVAHFSPKRRAIINLIMSLLLFFAMIIFIWKGTEIAWESFMRKEAMSTIWGPPAWTIKLWVPMGALFILLQGIADFLENLLSLIYPNEMNQKG